MQQNQIVMNKFWHIIGSSVCFNITVKSYFVAKIFTVVLQYLFGWAKNIEMTLMIISNFFLNFYDPHFNMKVCGL